MSNASRDVSPSDQDSSFLPRLASFLEGRRAERPEGSYSVGMMTDPIAVQRKIMEEAFEVCLELGAPKVDRDLVAEEAADVVFHLMCGVLGAGVSWADVEAALLSRHGGSAPSSERTDGEAGAISGGAGR